MGTFRAAVFDLDGTLLDSMGIWRKIDTEFWVRRGRDVPEGYFEKMAVMGSFRAAEYTVREYGLPDTPESVVTEWDADAIREYRENVRLKPGAAELLRLLRGSGIRLATATASPERYYVPALKKNGIYDLFEAHCSTDETDGGKENPDVFLLAARRLGIPPEDCVAFEDSPQGAASARRAGMRVVGVYDNHSAGQEAELRKFCDDFLRTLPEGARLIPQAVPGAG